MHTVTKAYISLAALKHNLDQVRLLVGDDVRIMPIVKANAYGHGLVPVCSALFRFGVDYFGVATLDEGLTVKAAVPKARVILLGGSLPDQAGAIVDAGLVPVVYDLGQAYALDHEAGRRGRTLPVHLKVDTGMTRLGVRYDEALAVAETMGRLRNVALVGVMTHLATADVQDSSFVMTQLDRFDFFLSSSGLIGKVVAHAANSSALMRYPRSHYDMVRPGIMLYGVTSSGASPPGVSLKPVMRLVSRVIRIAECRPGESVGYGQTFVAPRPMRIAVVPIGYADGYSYALSNSAEVLIRGARCPVVGRVSMDMITVALKESSNVGVGDEVVILGSQNSESITINELAFIAKTIPYEIFCNLSDRIDRIYVDEPQEE